MSQENKSHHNVGLVEGVRGAANTRLDTFVDAAFAFGSTVLLISSGDLPSTYVELVSLLKDIPAFVLSFFTMMIFWLSHRSWSRHYGLEDKVTIPLTLLLVVSLLVYIYPLKLMYSTLLTFMSRGYFPSGITITSQSEGVSIIGFYGFGFALLSLSMFGLYWRTHAVRHKLNYTVTDRKYAQLGIATWSVLVVVPLVSGIIALMAPVRYAIWAGMIYLAIPILMPAVLFLTRKRLEKVQMD